MVSDKRGVLYLDHFHTTRVTPVTHAVFHSSTSSIGWLSPGAAPRNNEPERVRGGASLWPVARLALSEHRADGAARQATISIPCTGSIPAAAPFRSACCRASFLKAPSVRQFPQTGGRLRPSVGRTFRGQTFRGQTFRWSLGCLRLSARLVRYGSDAPPTQPWRQALGVLFVSGR